MEKRLVKKEEIEKQLQEIVALIEQVDAKMEKVVADVIEERYAQNQAQLERLEGRIADVERRLEGGKRGAELPLSSFLGEEPPTSTTERSKWGGIALPPFFLCMIK